MTVHRVNFLLPKGLSEKYKKNFISNHFKVVTDLDDLAYDIIKFTADTKFIDKKKFMSYINNHLNFICSEEKLVAECINANNKTFLFYYLKKPIKQENEVTEPQARVSVHSSEVDFLLLKRVSVRRK